MRSKKAILLTVLVALTSLPLHRGANTVYKLTAFAHHFLHHISCEAENIGLNDFVYLHYSDHTHHKGHHDDHENLPFQDHQHHSNSLFSLVMYWTDVSPLSIKVPEPIFVKNFFNNFIHPTYFVFQIWKPPRA